MIVDSHCHLDFPDFEDDRDAILARAREAGIGTIVTISTRVRRYPGLRALVETHDGLYSSIGTHPHNAAEDGIAGWMRIAICRSTSAVT